MYDTDLNNDEVGTIRGISASISMIDQADRQFIHPILDDKDYSDVDPGGYDEWNDNQD